GHWNPTRNDPSFAHEGGEALAPFRTSASHRYGWLLRVLQPTTPNTCRWRNPIEPPPPAPRPKRTAPDTTSDLNPIVKKRREEFACTLCAASYKGHVRLTRHLRYFHPQQCQNAERKRARGMEEKEKTLPFQCDQCEFGALSKTGLLSHIRARHRSSQDPPRAVTPRPILYCPICLRPMGNAGGLASHMKYKHPGGLKNKMPDQHNDTLSPLKQERKEPPPCTPLP
ncbi:hypothetical protein DQ04_12991000, partial [Trypanosoma grayi]|uniref:hypothetical protein n=1 Tax=Trypanosoma grayi TaxID=71804 RepID=UPI0004F461CA